MVAIARRRTVCKRKLPSAGQSTVKTQVRQFR
jgi:hypothetical protein